MTALVRAQVDNFLAKTTRSGVLIRKTKRSRENRTALLAVAAAMEDVHLRQFRFAKLAAAKQAAVRLLPTRFNCLKCGWPIPPGTSNKPKTREGANPCRARQPSQKKRARLRAEPSERSAGRAERVKFPITCSHAEDGETRSGAFLFFLFFRLYLQIFPICAMLE